MVLIAVEKLIVRIPKVFGRVERFYNIVVEESLLGQDPDVAEDIIDEKTNIEAITRKYIKLSIMCTFYEAFLVFRRQRFEVCVVFHLSIIRSIIKIFINVVFLIINIMFGHEEKALITSKRSCVVAVNPIPELQVFEETKIHFQCDGKKSDFFLSLLDAEIVLLSFLLFITIAFLGWTFRLRR